MKKRTVVILALAVAALLFASGCASPFSIFKNFSLQSEAPSGNDFFDALGELTENGEAFKEAEKQETEKQEEASESDTPADSSVIEFIDEDGCVLLNGAHIASATYSYDQFAGHCVLLVFTEEGDKLFTEVTKNNIGRTISIYANGELISAPVINDVITGGEAIISGNFTEEEAIELCKMIENATIS